MTLTETPTEQLLTCDTIRHSALGSKFMKLLAEHVGIHAAACYTEISPHIGEKTHSVWKKFLIRAEKENKPAQDRILNIYYHADVPYRICENDACKAKIADLFRVVCREHGIDTDYDNIHVFLECIESLALWNLLADSLADVRRLSILQNTGIRVFCGYDKKRNASAYYLILPESMSSDFDTETLVDGFVREVVSLLTPADRFHAVNPGSAVPILCKWSDLSAEMRFALAKG